ncbi:MAG TPA: alpha/beta hydrolase-fold protein [Actinomycetota bacterium]|nr:alpha/beta hydrolase-fold protein [Actinomycetota bacterium]
MGTAPLTERTPGAPLAPLVRDDHVMFRLADWDAAMQVVELSQEVMRPRLGPRFDFDDDAGEWRLRFARPDADRMEYMFHLVHKDGGEEWINDPGNSLTAPGPFGAKSVIEWPEYVAPSWLEQEAPPGTKNELVVTTRSPRAPFRIIVWASPGLSHDRPAPLLVAHDGPEYDELSSLTRLLEVRCGSGDLPPMRAALIAPVARDHSYSASAAYSRAFAYDLLPAIERAAPIPHGRSMRVGMGASLGGLAMLHIHRTGPATFGGLFLQSGSFFRQRFDKQESGFPRFRRISRFMGQVLTAEMWAHPIATMMTCGTIEENLANNRATRDALARQAYEVRLVENRDGHNWVGWRDTFDPYLVDLLQRMWS